MKKKKSKELSSKINELSNKISEKGIHLRLEKGRFKSSLCLVDKKQTLMINKILDQTQIIDFMETFLKDDKNNLQAS